MARVSCVIPAYNEELGIKDVLTVVCELRDEGSLSEIIVVSDGSTDRTAEIARAMQADLVIELSKNQGKAGAVITGILKAAHDSILLLDGDLVGLRTEHIKRILEPLQSGAADMVIGYLGDDAGQNILPQLSGQRAFHKEILSDVLSSPKWRESRYGFEIMLSRHAATRKSKTLCVPLEGVSHIMRSEKYGHRRAWMEKTRFTLRLVTIYHRRLILSLASALVVFVLFIVLVPFRGNPRPIPICDSPKASDSIMVIVAHPDDEVVGAGGYLADAIRSHARVTVVIATNGDANRWAAFVGGRKVIPKYDDFVEEGNERIAESKRALSRIGLPENRVYFLGFPDRGLRVLLRSNWNEQYRSHFTHWGSNLYERTYGRGTTYTGQNVVGELEELIARGKPNIIITHSSYDHNSDHRGLNSFVHLAVGELAARDMIVRPQVRTFLVHWRFSEYPRPLRLQTNQPLEPPKDLLKKCAWQTYPLSKEDVNLKLQAVKEYKSQATSPYLRELLAAFVRTNELFCQEPPP